MAVHGRGMIKKSDLTKFQVWLDANGQAWRPGKGDFQLMQVKIGKGWGAICTDAQGVITTPPDLASMLRLFKQGKPMPQKQHTAPVKRIMTKQQFEDDLRDDFAMATMASITGTKEYFDGAWSQSEVARQSYDMADAMMAERAKRLKQE